MELDKNTLGLALLPHPSHLDGFNNPYELLNDLVNVSPLGTLTSTSTKKTPPPARLLQVPDQCPNPNWLSECWTFNFPQRKNILDLEITFPLPVHLSEAQIICGGEKNEWPSNMVLEVEDDQAKTIQGEPFLLAPLLEGPGAWVSIPLKEPRLVWRALLRIQKPKNSGSCRIFRIRLLEQIDLEMNDEDFNLDNFKKRVMDSKVRIPDMLKYCHSLSGTPGTSKAQLDRVSAILRHFKKEEVPKKEEQEPPKKEEEEKELKLKDMPVIQELLASGKLPSKLKASLGHDDAGALKLIFEQFNPQMKKHLPPDPDLIHTFLKFFSLPKYREVFLGDIFLDRADCMLRLALGVTKGEDGGDILQSYLFQSLHTLPFEVLNWTLEILPSSEEGGQNLRKKIVEEGAIQSVLDCFDRVTKDSGGGDAAASAVKTPTPVAAATTTSTGKNSKTKTPWAKGTGYGMGSTSVWPKGTGYNSGSYGYSYGASSRGNKSSTKDIEADENRKRERKQSKEEERMICLLNVLANFLKNSEGTGSEFLEAVNDLLKKSSLITVLSGYLRNESVLDLADHVPLYRVMFQLLNSIASIPELWSSFMPKEGDSVILELLNKLKSAVTTYSQLLKTSKSQDWELIQLLQDIQTIAAQVEGAVAEYLNSQKAKPEAGASGSKPNNAPSKKTTVEDRYVEEMKKLQFAFMKMIGDKHSFLVPYHYAAQARKSGSASGQAVHARLKRLAQESATLSTSLPLSYGSSIFLRCDNDRLDVIKVLITGPAGTPYSNGCFEFDIHFPLNYPQSPPMVNLETTGGRKVRFNPNLYNCGKVCLSILNTWHGSKEEMWNPKTSTLLPVLVAIQSLILVDEPYFNEPGHQYRGASPESKRRSREYNANIRYYTLKWAMLDQIKNHKSCFQDVIQRHFWIKRDEILGQLEEWSKNSSEMNAATPAVFKETVSALKSALLKITAPDGMEDNVKPSNQKGKSTNKRK